MNDDFETVRNILVHIRDLYVTRCKLDVDDPAIQITERDIVADIRQSLSAFCSINGYQVHCEIRPANDGSVGPNEMKKLPRIDVVILRDTEDASWLNEAKKLQGKYRKGSIEARFSSIPVRHFHTAIEAKIQSNVSNSKKDIDTLKDIEEKNSSCNCFFVLLNARGRYCDNEKIMAYAHERNVSIIEYTAQHL